MGGEMFGFGFGMFGLFGIIFAIVSLVSLAFFVFIFITIISNHNKNNRAPRLSVPATVVAKRAHSVHHHHNSHSIHHHSSTSYLVTFQVESGDRMELHLSGPEYGLLVEGDRGTLTFQGTRYLSFQRN